jgi:hypothetical protein
MTLLPIRRIRFAWTAWTGRPGRSGPVQAGDQAMTTISPGPSRLSRQTLILSPEKVSPSDRRRIARLERAVRIPHPVLSPGETRQDEGLRVDHATPATGG